MARSRNIKPGFFTNDVLAECDPLARLLFAGLWTVADREGRLEDRPRKLKAELLPYDDCDVDALLTQLTERRFVVRYTVDGNSFIQIENFGKHQNPHVKEAESTIPAPDKHRASTGDSGTSHADSLLLIPDSSSGASTRPPRKKPARACPETFEVNDTMAQWAVSQGLPEQRIMPETEKFLDHWRATGKLRNDWDATWRNWIRKAVEFGQR